MIQEPLVLPMLLSAFTHSDEPSYPLCQLSLSSEPSALILTRSASSPPESFRTRWSPAVFTSMKEGFTTRNSPGMSSPESCSVPFLLPESSSREYPVRSMAESVLLRISTHSFPRSVPGGLDSYSLIISPVFVAAPHLIWNPASMLSLAPGIGRGIESRASFTPGTSLSVSPSS